MLDWRPERSARPGLSSAPTLSGACTMVAMRLSLGKRFSIGASFASSPTSRKSTFGKRFRAMLAPRTTLRGALSPPRASRAMVRRSAKLAFYPPSTARARVRRLLGLGLAGTGHLAAVIIAARPAHVMRKFHLAAIGALVVAGGL